MEGEKEEGEGGEEEEEEWKVKEKGEERRVWWEEWGRERRRGGERGEGKEKNVEGGWREGYPCFISLYCRHASALWHWPYCISIGEPTIEKLLNMLDRFCDLNSENSTPPFHSRE